MIYVLSLNIIESMATGTFFLILLFLLSAFLVISVKLIYKSFFESTPTPEHKPAPAKKPRKVYRTIDIDPTQVDRIRVKHN